MLIWGSKGREIKLAEGQFNCPQCGSPQAYQHIRAARYFTLYFIPVFQLENLGELIKCGGCGSAYTPDVLQYQPPTPFEQWVEYLKDDLASGTPIEIAQRKLINGGMQQEMVESMVAAAAGTNRKTCGSCNLTFVPGVSNCSACGGAI